VHAGRLRVGHVFESSGIVPPPRGDLVAGAHQVHRGGLVHCRQRQAELTWRVGLLREFLGRSHGAPSGVRPEGPPSHPPRSGDQEPNGVGAGAARAS